MWGTARVRGEDDVIVRRLDFDERYCWKTAHEVDGHIMHADEHVDGFVAHDWSWLERRSLGNPDAEAFWEWNSTYGEKYFQVALSWIWTSWGFGLNYERQYGSDSYEDWWNLTWSLGPFHATLMRFWNVKDRW